MLILLIGPSDKNNKYIKELTDLCNKYYSTAKYLAIRALNRYHLQQDAEDVVISAFNKIFEESASIFENAENLTDDYLWSIVEREVRRAVDRHRKKEILRNNKIIPIDQIKDISDQFPVAMPTSSVEAQEIWNFLYELPDKYRDVLMLYAYDWTTKDIALHLNTTPENVRMIRSRAKNRLEALFVKKGFSPDDF